MINKDVLSRASQLAEGFQRAVPFKYLCIDNFFEDDDAERLLSDFPPFDTRKAVNEFGEVGRKAVHTGLNEISAHYARFYEYLLSREFLDAMSAMTGIPDLLPDPRMYGRGTHENVHGQSMDPHVDFNYDQDHGFHRRLNLIVYLNKGWKEEWGGALELHSNPRTPEADQVKIFNCIYNRAVIFETNEYSWHGFERVNLPSDESHRSRKSLSIYLYTKTRPQEEIAPPHGTFYVQRPLSFVPTEGVALTKEQVAEIEAAIKNRDKWIHHYQDLELKLSGQVQTSRSFINELMASIKPPITGAARPSGRSAGLYHDGWISSAASFGAAMDADASSITVAGYIPETVAHSTDIQLLVDGVELATKRVDKGAFTVKVSIDVRKGKVAQLDIRSKKIGGDYSMDGDQRDRSFILSEVAFSSSSTLAPSPRSLLQSLRAPRGNPR